MRTYVILAGLVITVLIQSLMLICQADTINELSDALRVMLNNGPGF